jgi:ABC-type bacteriocin/lantibiotic exporter with double-glycine peptidase domain
MSKGKVTIGSVFKTIIWPRKNLLLVGLLLIIISRLASLVLPGASKYLIDDVIVNNDFEKLKWIIIAVASAIVVQAITSFLLKRFLSICIHSPNL